MTVSFGSPKTAWFGKTALTKSILKGYFRINTTLGFDEIEQAIVETCTNYPVKTRHFLGDEKVVYRYRKQVKQKVVSYGSFSTAKDGDDFVAAPEWSLAPVVIRDNGKEYKVFKVVTAKMVSGKINNVEEMECFLNELEQRLRRQDAQAAVTLGQ